MEKKCTKCNQIKPLTDYYPDKRRVDGRYSSCKRCADFMTERYRRTSGYKRNPLTHSRRQKRYVLNNPIKVQARKVYRRALMNGTLIRQPCETCGKKAEGHHDDYSKPLEVRWLCKEHHVMHHYGKYYKSEITSPHVLQT